MVLGKKSVFCPKTNKQFSSITQKVSETAKTACYFAGSNNNIGLGAERAKLNGWKGKTINTQKTVHDSPMIEQAGKVTMEGYEYDTLNVNITS